MSDLLEDLTLAEALEKNKIFLCDLEITDNLECKDNREVCITVYLPICSLRDLSHPYILLMPYPYLSCNFKLTNFSLLNHLWVKTLHYVNNPK